MTPQTEKVVEKRIITASKEDWQRINSFLFDLNIQVPVYPFDIKRFVNSNTGLTALSFNSLVKLTDNERFLIIQKLLSTFGLKIATGEDGISIWPLEEQFSTEQFNLLDQVYKRYISSISFKNQKLSSEIVLSDSVEDVDQNNVTDDISDDVLEGDLVLNEDHIEN